MNKEGWRAYGEWRHPNILKEIKNNMNLREDFSNYAEDIIINKVLAECTYTEAGSLKYLLWGRIPSDQSIVIKVGDHFQNWFIKLAEAKGFEILPHGILDDIVENRKKDVDMLFRDPIKNIVYYFELKANAGLDSEKRPATVRKIEFISNWVKEKYKCEVVSGLLWWSVFDGQEHRKYESFKSSYLPIKMITPKEYFDILGVDFDKQYWDELWERMGKLTKINNNE